ncbi:hypothetical protein CHISP_1951 [Chitinispirillum alkaliphilum]|nr:hypothetical protein CHISP_1951 [Chitinispirillum alkaliphilum]
MIELTEEMVVRSWEWMDSMEIDEIHSMVDQLGDEQPDILSYLVDAGKDILNQQEREKLIFMGVATWKIIRDVVTKPPFINLDLLSEKEELNFRMLEYLAGEPDNQFRDTVEMIMGKYPQTALLTFITELIIDENEDLISLKKDNSGIIAIYIKTIIDCFEEAA